MNGMNIRRRHRQRKARAATLVVALMALWLEIIPGVESATVAATEDSLLDEEPCSIPPALYFRGSSWHDSTDIASGAGGELLDIERDDSGAGNSRSQVLAIDCDDGGASSSSSHDQLLGIDRDDDDNIQALDVNNAHQISGSSREPSSNGHDNVDSHQRPFAGIPYESVDSSATGDGRDHGSLEVL